MIQLLLMVIKSWTSQISVDTNFGQDSSFAGEKSSGNRLSNDADGIGDFNDTSTKGYLALCSPNLPDTTLSPNQSEQAIDHFNTVFIQVNGSTNAISN